jgi:hypothetical protein
MTNHKDNRNETWLQMEKLFPGSTVQWDVQGGPEWIAGRSGPRIYLTSQTLYIYVGGSGNDDFPWQCVGWNLDIGKWILDGKHGQFNSMVELNGSQTPTTYLIT